MLARVNEMQMRDIGAQEAAQLQTALSQFHIAKGAGHSCSRAAALEAHRHHMLKGGRPKRVAGLSLWEHSAQASDRGRDICPRQT